MGDSFLRAQILMSWGHTNIDMMPVVLAHLDDPADREDTIGRLQTQFSGELRPDLGKSACRNVSLRSVAGERLHV